MDAVVGDSAVKTKRFLKTMLRRYDEAILFDQEGISHHDEGLHFKRASFGDVNILPMVSL